MKIDETFTESKRAPKLQVQNNVQFGVLGTTLYYVFVWRTEDAAGKTVYFSKKIPPNFSTVYRGQQLTLKVILAAELYRAATEGKFVREDTWAQTPELVRWTRG